MADEIIKRDENRVTAMAGVTDDGNEEIRNLRIDTATGRLKVQATVSALVFDDIAPTTTKGDMIVHNGTTNVREPVGTDGHVLTADSADPNGVKWAAPAGGGTPGGSTTQVQYNNAGSFAGITGATTNGTALTLVAPVLGTPASGTLTNCTGLPLGSVTGLGANVSTFLATPSSANLRSALTDETGTGSAVFATSPTLTTPVLGAATATSINGVSIPLATSATLDLADSSTLATSGANSITLTSSGATNVTLPTTGTLATIAGSETLTNKTLTSPVISTISNTGTLTLPTSTDTLIGRATTDTLTNKRVTKRVTTITSNATPTVNTDNCDCVDITALAAAITSMTTNLSGTPTNFQSLIVRIKDNGTARAITWGASFVANGVALPTTTVISKLLTVGFIWNGSTWGCVASAQEA